jgi:alpha-glucosidase
VSDTAPRTNGRFRPVGAATVDHQLLSGVRLSVDSAVVEVTALAPDLWRVGLFSEGRTPDYSSEALAGVEWDPVEVSHEDSGGTRHITSSRSGVHLQLDPLRLSFSDSLGRKFAEDEPARGMGWFPLEGNDPFAWPVGPPVRLHKRRPPGERFFGCGERTSGLEKTDSHQIFWNVDPPIGHTAASNNLYTSIPLLLALRQGSAWGLFFDSTHRVVFDLAHEDPDSSYFSADGGNLIYYVFAGPSPHDVVARYTELTGRTPMPPMWALGNQQSRYSYMNEEEVRDIASTFRARDIPCDTVYLDIDYMDGYRVFTWDEERFPRPKQMLADLEERGFKTIPIIDPGVKVDERYDVYCEGRDGGFFCTDSSGGEFHNVVWPGTCAFPDFTNPRTRDWWGDHVEELLDDGVAGIWCDMNEPALFIPLGSTMPENVVHPGGGLARVHAQVHNAYGSLMARAVREGMLRARPNRRPVVITRSGYAGLQRHALQWTGDNSSWWEHLWMGMPQLQNMGLSGVAWAGVDVGGFFGDCNGELLARWTEFGAFQPFCRNHCAKGFVAQEPWAFGEPWESVCRKLLKLRQRLLPYIYSAFEECHRTGAPILRSLLYEYPEDEATYTTDDEFLLGRSLLVAPISRPGIEYRYVYLPRGTWYHYWSGERIEGPAHVLAHAPLGQPALYVLANRAIPMWPEMSHVGEAAPDPLTWVVFPGEGTGESWLYEDEGEGYAYLDGVQARTRVECGSSGEGVDVRLGARDGAYDPPRMRVELEVRGLGWTPSEIQVDGGPAEWQAVAGSVVVSLPESSSERTIRLRR